MQENILSKKLSLGLNFSTPSGEVTSPLLNKGSLSDGEKAMNLLLFRLHYFTVFFVDKNSLISCLYQCFIF